MFIAIYVLIYAFIDQICFLRVEYLIYFGSKYIILFLSDMTLTGTPFLTKTQPVTYFRCFLTSNLWSGVHFMQPNRHPSNRTAVYRATMMDGILGGKFTFKKLPDGSVDKSKVICTLCKAQFNYHRSNSSLSYHLRAKHPTETTSTWPRQATLQECATRGRISKPVNDKLTNSLVTWIISLFAVFF